jgi:hypothetical protein
MSIQIVQPVQIVQPILHLPRVHGEERGPQNGLNGAQRLNG